MNLAIPPHIEKSAKAAFEKYSLETCGYAWPWESAEDDVRNRWRLNEFCRLANAAEAEWKSGTSLVNE